MLEDFLAKGFTYGVLCEYINEELSKRNLDEYVTNECFYDNRINKKISAYIPSEQELFINVERISKLFLGWLKRLNLIDDKENRERYYKIFLAFIIEREIRHIEQIRESSDTENPILLEGIDMYKRFPFDLTKKEIKLYENYFDYIPLERNASIIAYLQILDDGIKYEEDGLSNSEEAFLRGQLTKYCKTGYSSDKCPTEKYYKLVDKKKEYKKLDLSNIDECHRTLWGLPEGKSLR